MKRNKKYLGLLTSGLLLAGLTQSCVSDEPFYSEDGEGTLRMQLVVNSDLTRAELDESELIAKCKVYISQAGRGLLYKYEGVSELPEALRLKSGMYVAEAWTGDSVTASFDNKFYRGCQKFEMTSGQSKQLLLQCRIANVVVSLDKESIDAVNVKNWKLTVGNSRGSLDFTEQEIDRKGYFMMPDADIAIGENGAGIPDGDGFTYYKALNYTLEGETADGRAFSKRGVIGNEDGLTQHAHEYVLKMKYAPEHEQSGGGLITIEVVDDEIEEKSEVGLYSRPAIKGANFDIDKQIQGNIGGFSEQIIKVNAFKSIEQLQLSTDDSELGIYKNKVDLITAIDDVKQQIRDLGITWEIISNEEKNLNTCYIRLTRNYLNQLPEREQEYQLKLFVKDGYGRTNEAVVRIAVGAGAFKEEDPVVVNEVSPSDFLSIRARRAVISGSVNSDADSPAILYRLGGSSDVWQKASIPATRSQSNFSVELKGLQPGRQYEYKAANGDWEANQVYYFTTETEYTIPFADMEIWNEALGKSAIQFPGDDYTEDKQFWDSGNHGSSAMGKSLTVGSTDLHNSGSKSAYLKSQYVGLTIGNLGAFAAGNLFMGRFGETVGMSGAMLTFGKPYDGSHPDKLSVYVTYTPGKVDYLKDNCPHKFNKNSDLDHGQVYVALATEPIKVNTGTSDAGGVPKGTFMQYDTDPRILGFGEITWAGTTCGSSSQMQKVEIPITWREGAKTKKPTTLIIVCSASKYGDYFTGSSGSSMYLDDFQLIYE